MKKRLFQLFFSLPLFIGTVHAQQNFPVQMAGDYTCETRYGCFSTFQLIIEVDTNNNLNFFLNDNCPNNWSGRFNLQMKSTLNQFIGASASCNQGSFFGEFFPTNDSLYAFRSEVGCGSGCTCGLYYKCKKVLPVGLEEDSELKIKIAPNPVQSQLSLEGIGQNLSYLILDLSGKRLSDGRLSAAENQINVENLPKGIYFLQLRQEDEVEVLKFVKQ